MRQFRTPAVVLTALLVTAVAGAGCSAFGGKKAPAPEPLWTRLGGERVVRAVVHDFVQRAALDPKANVARRGGTNEWKFGATDFEQLEQRVVESISGATGGPFKFAGKPMAPLYDGMQVSDAEFDATVRHLSAALDAKKVAPQERDELLGIVAGTRKDVVNR